jgi:hypothetical protein
MTPAADPLAGLRGYRLPEPVSWWPPAPGWWLLVLLGLVLLGLALVWILRRRRRRAPARAAARELAALRAALARDGDAGAFLRGLSRLLRRYALTRFPRERVAGLTGADWLAFLDAHGGGGRFAAGPGRWLADAPYRPAPELPAGALGDLAADWIRHNRDRASGPGGPRR